MINEGVNVAKSQLELKEIYKLRYEVYCVEQGKKYIDVEGCLKDDLDDVSENFYYAKDGVVIATCRLTLDITKLSHEMFLNYKVNILERKFDLNEISCTSRIIVKKGFRHKEENDGQHLGEILMHVALRAMEKGKKIDLCNADTHLIDFFKRCGYRPYTDHFEDLYSGVRQPLLLDGQNFNYMRSFNSSFSNAISELGLEGDGNVDVLKELFSKY